MQALQFWVEKSNLPILGQPCLLSGSILKLRKVMEPYVSFFADAILDSVAPPGFLEDQPKTTIPLGAQSASTDPPIEEAPGEEAAPVEEPSTPQTPCEEPTMKGKASPTQFLGRREVLHPS